MGRYSRINNIASPWLPGAGSLKNIISKLLVLIRFVSKKITRSQGVPDIIKNRTCSGHFDSVHDR